MDAEKVNFNFDKDCKLAELIIRETSQVVEKELPVLEPDNVEVNGTISAPCCFLEKRWPLKDQIDHAHTMIIVDRDNLSITLICNETDKRNKMIVNGIIETSRQYKDFHINDSSKQWEPIELGNFFRINRTYFESKEDNMNLVAKLKSFKANVKARVEKSKADNGSLGFIYTQAVDSNLPKAFNISIPIFKGTEPESIEVETDANINGTDCTLSLISTSAASIFEDARDKYIDEQLNKIREIAPEIPILEK